VKVVVTGAAGFLGRRVVSALRARGDDVIAVDTVATDDVVTGDIIDAAFLASVVTPDVDAVIHLASMVSGECEQRFDDAFTVNVGGTRAVLDAARHAGTCPRVVFASSVAVFGGGAVDDETRPAPASTYGMTKAIGELLVSEYTRKGYVDGRVARLPTVIIRPGAPNAAASSFASGMFREPPAGVDAVIPVGLATPMVLIGTRTAVAGLMGLIDPSGDALGRNRVMNLPGLEVTVADMKRAVEGSGRASGRLEVRPDAAVEAIVATWPGRWSAPRAKSLGLPQDASLDAIVTDYLRDC
jgi:nucleoside-diphosphate-sugar epimerase